MSIWYSDGLENNFCLGRVNILDAKQPNIYQYVTHIWSMT